MKINERLQLQLDDIRTQGLERKLYPDLSSHIDFTSNDYLGLAEDPRLLEAFQTHLTQEGLGSKGSRLLGGDRSIFHQLEKDWALWKCADAALFYNSGFNANLSLCPALCSKSTHIFSDKLNHASLYDGISLSEGILHRYAHCDLSHLESLLKKYPGEGIILTESVFSMDGDIAPLIELNALAKKYDCLLIVDEAHSDGVFGSQGKGLVHQLGLENEVDITLGTFGKAYGLAGAMISGRQIYIDTLLQKSRGLTYTTAQLPALAATLRDSIGLTQIEEYRREKLLHLQTYFRHGLDELGLNYGQSQSQIVPIIIGENHQALRWAQHLQDSGLWIQAIRHPTVPKGTARLRINLTALHKESDVTRLLNELKILCHKDPVL